MSIKVNFKTKKRMIVASMEQSQQEHYLGSISDNVSDSTLLCFKSDMYVLARKLVSLNSDSDIEEETEVGYLDLIPKDHKSSEDISQNNSPNELFQPNLVITPEQGDTSIREEDKDLFQLLTSVDADYVKFLLSSPRGGLSRLHRRYWAANSPDVFAFTITGGMSYRRTSVSDTDIMLTIFNRINSKFPQYTKGSVELKQDLLTKIISLARKYTQPVEKGSVSINWFDVLQQELIEEQFNICKFLVGPSKEPNKEEDKTTPCEDATVLKVGFTTKQAMSKMETLPFGNEFSRKSWPWFFDASGKFDLFQLANRGDKHYLLVNERPKGGKFKQGAKRKSVEITCTYESVRNAVAMSYAAAVMGTGILHYNEIEDEFKNYCDTFTVAVLTELSLGGCKAVNEKEQHVNSTLLPTYLNFQNETDVDTIIEQLTYPSGRLRVINVGKSSDGVFWYMRSNNKGVGPSVKPRRVRFSIEPIEDQINGFISELKVKANLPDLDGLEYQLKELLKIEANRVKSGLV